MDSVRSGMTRRGFLGVVLGPSALLLAAACSQAAPAPPTAAPAPTAAAAPKPTAPAAPAAAPTAAAAPKPTAAAPAAAPTTAPAVVSAPANKVVISFSDRTTSDLAMFLAKEEGLFDQQGIDADLQFIASNTGVPALISDQTQFALIGGPESLGAVVQGADLVAIVQLSGAQPYLMEVNKAIQTVEDLRGKKVGVSTLGSSSDTATRIALRAKGLDPDKDVSIVAVGSLENRMAAMTNGAVDAGLGSPPETLALEDGGLHPLFDLSTIDMPPLAQCLIVKRSTINSQKDLVQRVVNGMVAGAALQKKDREVSQKVLIKWANITDQRALDVAYDYWTGKILRIPPTLKPAEWQGFVDELANRNEKAKGFDPATMIDTSFVENAAAKGFAG
jgi:NitT/TauT family transport system substrate-binding protein